jgi:hypothetical protein
MTPLALFPPQEPTDAIYTPYEEKETAQKGKT